MKSQGKKVFVAMSGGVDSSVTALLLQQKKYNVIGVYMKGWSLSGPDAFSDGTVGVPVRVNCVEEDAADARRVAEKLGIPFYVFNFENEFKKEVVDYMINEYAAGKTPNPDVMCNREIKFGLFLKKALALGADYIATGHYVKNVRNRASNTLVIGKDNNKDQSYFLWTLTQEQLKYCLFPIGEYTKPQVRVLAKKYGLPTAGKPDSQGVCFIGEINVAEFLKEKLGKNPGPIKTLDGKIIGSHDGAIFYTIGQRKGIGIKGSLPGEQGKIYYVAEKDIDNNTLWVSEGDSKYLFTKELSVKNVNWISSKAPKLPLKCLARIRYRQSLQEAQIMNYELGIKNKITIYRTHKLPIGYLCVRNSKLVIQFKKPQRAITSGQSAVFYLPSEASEKEGSDLIMLGGGVIV